MEQVLRVALALATVSHDPPLPDAGSCDVSLLRNCYDARLKHFNLTDDPLPPYFYYAHQKSAYIIDNGLSGQKQVCQWQHDLEKCLGASVNSCITFAAWNEAYNVSRIESLLYVNDFHAFQYECGDGYDDLIKNFYCLLFVQVYRQDQLQDCAQKATTCIKQGFNCSCVYDNISCTGSVFSQECGQAASKFVCNLSEAILRPDLPECAASWPQC
uniref:Secreted protein n=1 Tax=Steinernema glaseri TaxID=37863 RepID=A0A1I7YTS5_9BILA